MVKNTVTRVTPGDGAFPPPSSDVRCPPRCQRGRHFRRAWRRDPGWQDVPTCGSHASASPAAGGQSS